MFIKQSYKVSLVMLAIVFRSTADRIPIKYICSYHCWDGIRHVSLMVGVNYGEEMHQLVKNFTPRQGYLRQQLIWWHKMGKQ